MKQLVGTAACVYREAAKRVAGWLDGADGAGARGVF